MFLIKLIKEIKNNSKKPKPLPKKEEITLTSTKQEYNSEDSQFKPQEKGSSEKEVFLPLDMDDSEDCEFELPSSDDEVDHFQIYSASRGTIKKEKEFESLEFVELVNRQQTEIINISSTLGLPVCVSGTLLRAYQWNTEK
jgi:hypothetical protein